MNTLAKDRRPAAGERAVTARHDARTLVGPIPWAESHGWTTWVTSGPVLAATDAVSASTAFILGIGMVSLLRNAWAAGAMALYLQIVGVCIGLLLLWFRYQGHYGARLPFWMEARQISIASLFGLCVCSVDAMLFGISRASSLAVASGWVLLPLMMIPARLAAKRVLRRWGLWRLRTVVAGDEDSVSEIRSTLNSDWTLGYEIVDTMPLRDLAGRYGTRSAHERLAGAGAEFLIVALGNSDLETTRRITAVLTYSLLPFAVVPACDGIPILGSHPYCVLRHGLMMISCGNWLAKPLRRQIKRAFDMTAALVMLPLLAVPMLVIAGLVRRDGGSALFAHQRIGYRGHRFSCYKFRTMTVNAQQVLQRYLAENSEAAVEWKVTRKLRDDPRVTPIGRFLRRTSLDELPQIFCVLKGDMSLVGPRPIVDSEAEYYGNNIFFYYRARPGITGLWQVSGRSNTSYARRVELDVWYVKNWSLWHDIYILLNTIPILLRRQGAV